MDTHGAWRNPLATWRTLLADWRTRYWQPTGDLADPGGLLADFTGDLADRGSTRKYVTEIDLPHDLRVSSPKLYP